MYVTEAEKKELDRKMLFFGYSEFQTDFFNSASFKRLRETMLDYLPYQDVKTNRLDFIPKSKVVQAGKSVIDNHFGDIDTRVFYTYGDDLESQIVSLYGKSPEPEQLDEIIDYINHHVSLIPVTDVPLSLKLDDSQKGGFCTSTTFYENDSATDDFLKKVPVCVNEIVISGDCDVASQCIYVHEMMHALVDRHKGSIRNLLSSEMPSIFMENVGALDFDPSMELYHSENFERILYDKYYVLDRDLLKYTNGSLASYMEECTYLYSSLLAASLFQIYVKGSKKIKKEIDEALGLVLTGDEVLEEILNYFEVTPEKGAKIRQKQIKDYHQRFVK